MPLDAAQIHVFFGSEGDDRNKKTVSTRNPH